jgi:hypothetical protein
MSVFKANLYTLLHLWILSAAIQAQDESKSPQLCALDGSALASYYTDYEICALNRSKTASTGGTGKHAYEGPLETIEYKTVKECREEYPTRAYFNPPQEFGSAYSTYRCCNDEVPLVNRGFSESLPGFADGSSSNIAELLRTVSLRNQSIIFVGDSLQRQTWDGLRSEIFRQVKLHMQIAFLYGVAYP